MISLVKITSQNWWDKYPKISYDEVRGSTPEEFYANYFKGFDNRYKYCNSIKVEMLDKEYEMGYRKWISDINNYANAGGDMW